MALPHATGLSRRVDELGDEPGGCLSSGVPLFTKWLNFPLGSAKQLKKLQTKAATGVPVVSRLSGAQSNIGPLKFEPAGHRLISKGRTSFVG